MIEATTDELLGYLADVIERAEGYGAIVAPPYDAPEVQWTRDGEHLAMDIEIRPPAARRARVEITLAERWRPIGADRYELDEYAYGNDGLFWLHCDDQIWPHPDGVISSRG